MSNQLRVYTQVLKTLKRMMPSQTQGHVVTLARHGQEGTVGADEHRGFEFKTFDKASRFVIEVGKAAHSYGSTTMQIESFLLHPIEVLGYRGIFRATVGESS